MIFPSSKTIRPMALAEAGQPIEVVLAACLTLLLLREYRKQNLLNQERVKRSKTQNVPKPKIVRLTREERDRERLERILNPPLRGIKHLGKKNLPHEIRDDPFWYLPEELRPVAQAHWDRLLERHRERVHNNPRLRASLKGNAVYIVTHPEQMTSHASHLRWYSKMRDLHWLRKYMAKQNAALEGGVRLDEILQEQRAGLDPIGRRLEGI